MPARVLTCVRVSCSVCPYIYPKVNNFPDHMVEQAEGCGTLSVSLVNAVVGISTCRFCDENNSNNDDRNS